MARTSGKKSTGEIEQGICRISSRIFLTLAHQQSTSLGHGAAQAATRLGLERSRSTCNRSRRCRAVILLFMSRGR